MEANMALPAHEALERLRAGNLRFVAGPRRSSARRDDVRRAELACSQEPFAIVLGCSDSRVPAEIVFDQGLGDLFVIRVAGNIVASSQLGSVEFAADRFGTRLVVVLGHSQCGAVLATLEELRRPTEQRSPHTKSIVDRIRPAVETLLGDSSAGDPALVRRAVRANVRAAANHLRHGSRLLETLIERRGLAVVGAEYSLETGAVEFFDGVPLESEEGRPSPEKPLLMYVPRMDAILTAAEGVRELGLDPEDPDWARIGWDWVAPRDQEAWDRLRAKRELAG
jgi:carbonic anhydrase